MKTTNSDVPSDSEILADVRVELRAILSGDLSGVAPWSTPEMALAELQAEQLRAVTRMVRTRAGAFRADEEAVRG